MTIPETRPRSGGPYDQRLARFLIKPFAKTGLHPNAVTGLSFALGLTAAYMFAVAIETMAGLAALLFMLAVLTDHADGELARMTGKTSKLGHRLDYIVGTLNYAALFVGLGIGLANGPMGDEELILGLTVGIVNPVICTLRLAMDLRHGGEAVAHPDFAGFELEDFIYLIGPIAWLGGIEYFFLIYGLGTFGYLVFTIVSFFRQEYFKQKFGPSGH
jgi:phosphatidylglycerophosphate synthase